MTTQKTKTKKCRRSACRLPFEPKVEWQKYCSDRCRDAISNGKRAALLRRALKALNAQVVQG
jgi:hypothetical protein